MDLRVSITTPTSKVKPGAARSSKIVFTVSNLGERPVEVQAILVWKVKPAGAQQPETWLRFDPPGNGEYILPSQSATNITVVVDIPPGAAASKSILQLLVLGKRNPDENRAESPLVEVELEQPAAPKKKPFPWGLLILGLVGCLVVIGAAIYFFWPRPPKAHLVPDVVDLSENEARATVTAAGLAFEKTAEIYTPDVPVGIVLATTPQAGATVGPSTPVYYVLVSEPSPTPTFTPTSIIASGLLTYKQTNPDGTVSIALIQPYKDTIKLVDGVQDAAVLDFTPANGGVYALWVLQSGRPTIWLVRADGSQIGSPIDDGWLDVKDADWTAGGGFLIIEATDPNTNKIYYTYVNNQGAEISKPGIP